MNRISKYGWLGVVLLVGCSALSSRGSTEDTGVTENDALASVRPRTRPKSAPADYVATPNGFFHPSCIASVHPDEREVNGVIVRADGSTRKLDACAYPRFDVTGRLVTTATGSSPPKPSS